jgi:formate--tetrahydrofolate ligase
MNDRTLRRVVVGLGGRPNGYARETGSDITAASEVMAVLAVARDLNDLRRRLGAITVAHRYNDAGPVTAEDLRTAGAMTVPLKDALKPNLIQTLERQPCLMHCGPFANIDHGNNSLIADLIAMKLGDYVVTESGFGSDMGMEKFFDIVCRLGGLRPSAAVLVTTVRAIKHHGGAADRTLRDRGERLRAIEIGIANVRRHLAIVHEFGVPCVVAISRRPEDPADELELVRDLALDAGAFSAKINEGFEKGGLGAVDLARAVVTACEQPNEFHHLYADDASIRDKIETVATRVYGARNVFLYPEAERSIDQFEHDGLGHFPVCMAKTHLSLSADPALTNAPQDFTVAVRDIRAYTGAGWLVPLCGDIQQMPSLGKQPAALDMAPGRGSH